MKRRRFLKPVNVVLAVVVVAVLLGCGGDLAKPPPGSTEEKLCGEWEGEPLPGTASAARKLSVYFAEGHGPNGGPGLVINYWEEEATAENTKPNRREFHQFSTVSVRGASAVGERDPQDYGSSGGRARADWGRPVQTHTRGGCGQ